MGMGIGLPIPIPIPILIPVFTLELVVAATILRVPRNTGERDFFLLFDNRVCDRAMALVDPLLSWAAGRDQFTKYIVIPDVVIGRCLMTAFGRAFRFFNYWRV